MFRPNSPITKQYACDAANEHKKYSHTPGQETLINKTVKLNALKVSAQYQPKKHPQ
jgi:hypothetical protein